MIAENFPLAIFALLTVAYHAKEIFLGEAYLFNDRLAHYANLQAVFGGPSAWSSFQWSPTFYFGTSFARHAVGLFFLFPDNICGYLFSPYTAVLVVYLFWFMLGQLFTFKFLQLFGVSTWAAIVGAVMYVFSGSTTHGGVVHLESMQINMMAPLFFYMAEMLARRFELRRALLFTLIMANSLYLYLPQLSAYLNTVCVVYYVVRVIQLRGWRRCPRHLMAMLSMIILALMLAAPGILPVYDAISNSVTAGGRPPILNHNSRLANLFVFLMSLIAPRSVGSDVSHANIPTLCGSSWNWAIYVGLLPLMTAGARWTVRRRRELWPLLGICLLALLFFVPNLLSPLLPDWQAIYYRLPLFGKFHIHTRFLFLGVFSASVLLTIALDSWSSAQPRLRQGIFPLIFFLIVAAIALASALWRAAPGILPSLVADPLSYLSQASGGNYINYTLPSSTLGWFLVLSFILVAVRCFGLLSAKNFLRGALVLLTADLLVYGLPLKPTLSTREFEAARPKFVEKIEPQERIITVNLGPTWTWDRGLHPFASHKALDVSLPALSGISSVGGYIWPTMTGDEYFIFGKMLAQIPLQRELVHTQIRDKQQLIDALKLWRLFAVDYLVTDMKINSPALPVEDSDGPSHLHRILGGAPKFYCSRKLNRASSAREALDQMIRLPAGTVVYTEEDAPRLGPGEFADCAIENIEAERTTRWQLKIRATPGGAFLVHTDRWTKEWKAEIDGQPAPLWPVNGMQRGLLVPEGEHSIVLRYEDQQLRQGICLAGLALMAIAVMLVYDWRRRRRHHQQHCTDAGPEQSPGVAVPSQ